jgi:hypothetical protein
VLSAAERVHVLELGEPGAGPRNAVCRYGSEALELRRPAP